LRAAVRPSTAHEPAYTNWDRARLSVVVPVGVIVAVAIVCIVVAVLSSAQRADEVATRNEMQLFSTALKNYGTRVLREVEGVAASDTAITHSRPNSIPIGLISASGPGSARSSSTDYIFVYDANDRRCSPWPAAARPSRPCSSPSNPIRPRLLAYMRGRSPTLHHAIRLTAVEPDRRRRPPASRRHRQFRGQNLRSLPRSRSGRSTMFRRCATTPRRS